MPTIMSYFFYEHSCRRLLALLTDKVQHAEKHRDEHKRRGEAEEEKEARYIEALLKAASAVDEQCKKLDFWSDMRGISAGGDASAEGEGPSWGHGWVNEDEAHDKRSNELTELDEIFAKLEKLDEERDEEADDMEQDLQEPLGEMHDVDPESIDPIQRQMTIPSGWVDGVDELHAKRSRTRSKGGRRTSSAQLNGGEELAEQAPEPIDDSAIESESDVGRVVKKKHKSKSRSGSERS